MIRTLKTGFEPFAAALLAMAPLLAASMGLILVLAASAGVF